MRAGGRGLLLLVLVCALVVSTGESRFYKQLRTSWTRPYQTHHLATTTTNKGNTILYHTNNHHLLNLYNNHHNKNNNHHRLFNNNNNNNNNQYHHHHRNSTRGHRPSTRNHNLPHADHNQRRHNNHQNDNHLHHNNNDTRDNGRRYHHPRSNNNNILSHASQKPIFSSRKKHHQHIHHPHHHHQHQLANLFAIQNHPKQSIKRHLRGMRRHLQYQTPFLQQPMRMQTPFRSALSDSLSYHRSPQLWDMSRLRSHHERIMHHLSSRLRDHVMRMRSSSVPHVANSHYRHYPGHHRPSHHQSGSRGQDSLHSGQRLHCNHDQPRQHDTRVDGSTRPSGTQFKIARGGFGDMPEEVEVFRWPATPPSQPRPPTTTTTTTTTSTTTTPRPITIDNNIIRKTKNCTTSATWRPHSSTHPRHAGSSRGRPNYQPPPAPGRPDPIHQNPILNALFPSPTLSTTPGWKGREAGGSGDRHNPTSVQDHLSQPGHSRPTPTSPTSLPCIKCPSDTRVQAPRGRDCVYAQTPSPLPCTSQWRPDVQTIVTEGPTPGTRLQEGHYAISFTVVVMEESRGATPIASCSVGYDVEVRKCPELPRRAGLEARCSAGRAWGSRCTWRCAGNLQLRGAAATTCSGHRHPRWTHKPPSCVSLLPPAPPPPPARNECKAPPDVPGGHYNCRAPVDRHVNVPILKDDPTVQRAPRDTTPIQHFEGTMCELECGHGRTITVSLRGRRRLTCTSGGHWDYRPPPCRLQMSPVLQDGDCKDTTLRPPHSPLSFLPLPNFRTSSGVAARVTCVLEARSEGSHTRTCTAEDPELETKTHCKYRITLLDVTPDPDAVLIPGLTGRTGTGHGFGGEAGRGTDRDHEWGKGRQHQDNGNSESTGDEHDIYAYSSNERDEEDDDYEFDYDDEDEDYYYDGSDFDDGDFIDDYDSEIETIPELQRVQSQTLESGTKRRGSHGRKAKKHRVNETTRNSTTTKHSTTIRRQGLEKTKKTSSFSLSLPSSLSSYSSPSSSYSSSLPSSDRRKTVVAEDVLMTGKNSGATVHEAMRDGLQVSAKGSPSHHSRERRNRRKPHRHNHAKDERTSGYNLHNYTVETNENGTLTQKEDWRKGVQLTSFSSPPSDNQQSSGGAEEAQPRRSSGEQSVPATMEAVVKVEVTVGTCNVAREVARLLGMALKDQERCGTALTCHNPGHTCKELSAAGGQAARVELMWAVGGLYENHEGDNPRPHHHPQHHPHHVPEVETAISAILESTRGIVTSSSLALSLSALGATVDADSFLVTQLDLVCRQPGLTLQPETNRCWPE